MRSLLTRFVPALALLAGFASPALAQEDRNETYPVVYGQRPITLHAEQFTVDVDFNYLQLPGEGVKDPIFATVELEYGVMKNLTVGTLPVVLGLSPKAEVTGATAFGRYRFLFGAQFPVELAAELQVTFPFDDDRRNFGIAPGLRMRYFLNNAARLDLGLFLNVDFADPDALLGLSLPVDLSISFTRQIFFQINTGLNYPNFDASEFTVPLGLALGYTVPRNEDSPFLDIFLGFSFPFFASSFESIDTTDGSTETTTELATDIWQIMIGAKFFAN